MLSITLDQVKSFCLSQGVSVVTYHCPLINHSSYYEYADQSIHINRESIQDSLETLGCNKDIWLDMKEAEVYILLHELGHHLQPSSLQGYEAEVDAWNRAEAMLLSLNGEVPKNFFIKRDDSLRTHSSKKNDSPTLSFANAELESIREKFRIQGERIDALYTILKQQMEERFNYSDGLIKATQEGRFDLISTYNQLIQNSELIEQSVREELDSFKTK